ncbi:hypothetical protein EJ377_02240 [Chryseobacterium arthrosphaerae]|uniref:Uncharacterized protein n=1 Tax=Chryseobacterium arthrosphaerae TaxID=651561 RepID=A0A432DYN0_9FLAO|nr:hypothetical protein EJ377_02240 [Chryseobacterium arthrosphaerae]
MNDFSKWDYWKDVAIPELDRYKNTWKFFLTEGFRSAGNKDKKPVVAKKLSCWMIRRMSFGRPFLII